MAVVEPFYGKHTFTHYKNEPINFGNIEPNYHNDKCLTSAGKDLTPNALDIAYFSIDAFTFKYTTSSPTELYNNSLLLNISCYSMDNIR